MAILSRGDVRRIMTWSKHFANADLRGACLVDMDLRDANFRNANLWGVAFDRSNLAGAVFDFACLCETSFRDALNVPPLVLARTRIVPDGPFIGWKKAIRRYRGDSVQVIVKLLIPSRAKRSSGTGRQCRASFVKVLEIDGSKNPRIVAYPPMFQTPDTKYRVGEIVKADKWDDDRWKECTHGIHFFLTREEAEAY